MKEERNTCKIDILSIYKANSVFDIRVHKCICAHDENHFEVAQSIQQNLLSITNDSCKLEATLESMCVLCVRVFMFTLCKTSTYVCKSSPKYV